MWDGRCIEIGIARPKKAARKNCAGGLRKGEVLGLWVETKA